MKIIKVNVHQIVDLLLRKGDIDTRFYNIANMALGTKIHQKYQDSQLTNYEAEVSLTHQFVLDDFILQVSGKADGIITNSKDDVTIDEIKTTSDELENFYNQQKDWHLGQAMFYAYMYAYDNKLDKIKVQLTYISQLSYIKRQQYLFFKTFKELEEEINILVDKYVKFLKIIDKFQLNCYESIYNLEFPFENLRKDQDKLMDFVYKKGMSSSICYIQAKTGIGKTISNIYPFLKVLNEKKLEKIFYLTSKSSIKMVAFNTIKLLEKNGLNIKCLVLTSKEKICLNDKKGHCNVDECPFAKGYYDKVNEIIVNSLYENNLFDLEKILQIAQENQICPFEFQLDLANYCQFIIGDYNYLFDPHAKLERFFATAGLMPSYLLLIDEAHNLPSRVNDMFSISIKYTQILDAYNYVKELKYSKRQEKLVEAIKKLGIYFMSFKNIEPYSSNYPNIYKLDEVPFELLELGDEFVNASKEYIKKQKIVEDVLNNLMFLFQDMANLPNGDPNWCIYFEYDNSNNVVSFNMVCVDSSNLIKNNLNYFNASSLFSATLSPKNYFIDLLGGDRFSSNLYLPSSFPKENQLLIVNPFIKTFYNSRKNSIQYIIRCVLITISKKVGNYLLFFPSYEYMMLFKKEFVNTLNIDIYYQENNMSEQKREEFLSHFVKKPNKTCLGVGVLGGVFSEGVDLSEDRLIGAFIVSVGLPKISFLNDYTFNYYKEKYDEEVAYDYTYTYPGINKVFQASGRVIRSENDKGIIMLIDTRYISNKYQNLLEDNFENIYNLNKDVKLDTIIEQFWKQYE